MISYGTNIVSSIQSEYRTIVEEYISKYKVEHCFETPNMHVLNDAFEKFDHRICFMAEYFLPDIDRLQERPCKFELRVLLQADFKDLYLSEWANALCEDRKTLDVIGVDVLPEYRRHGIASVITSKLALEILKKDIVPFYCCAWSNIKSARNAISV